MDKFIQKTRELFLAKQGGIFSSALILSAMIVISSIFGFLRYRILATYFTTGDLDIFFAAFRIPDLVFEILITGALTSSFIPIYIKYQKNSEELETNVSSIFNLLCIALSIFVFILYFSLDFLIPALTPGFKGEKLRLVILYSKILLVGQLPFLVIGNFLTGIAQAKKIFLISAISPIVYNISVIVATFLLSSSVGLAAPIWGVDVGAVLFLLVQIPILTHIGINYKPIIKITEGVREFFTMIGPRILTVLIAQIDSTIDLSLTSLLGTGAYTIFYFAQHLQLLPVSIVGVAFGQASLPYLSELFEQNKIEEFKKLIIDSLLNLLFLTIPMTVYFIFARTPLVRIFFGGERFDWSATVQTAFTLSYFAISIPFHTVYYFLTRSFYALLDSRTPFLISLITIAINTSLSLMFVLIFHLPVWALAISFSISVIINTSTLFLLLHKKIGGLDLQLFASEISKAVFCALIAAPPSYYFIKLFDNLILDTTRTINVLFLLGISVLIYFLLYLFLSWLMSVKALYSLVSLIAKAKQFKKNITEMPHYE